MVSWAHACFRRLKHMNDRFAYFIDLDPFLDQLSSTPSKLLSWSLDEGTADCNLTQTCIPGASLGRGHGGGFGGGHGGGNCIILLDIDITLD